MGPVGVQEMVVIFLIALVLFGPKKLPELGRTIGKALTEFRRASNDLKSSFEREMNNLERETDSLKDVAHQTANEIYSHTDYTSYVDENGHTIQQPATTSHELPSPDHTNPSTVGASEVPGAESQGTNPVTAGASAEVSMEAFFPDEPIFPSNAKPPVEGTIPRSGAPEATPQHS
jgi:TatA/E family protein of Tat protein translocase